MKILVADDDRPSRQILETLLQAGGHWVETATNGAEGLARIGEQRFDLIISDVLMPDMDGFQFCRAVRTNEATKHIPFIFYTATYTDPSDEQFAMSLGAQKFIVKPAEPSVFIEMINAVITDFSGAHASVQAAVPEETVFLRQYNARLVKKLEDKITELEDVRATMEHSRNLLQTVIQSEPECVKLMAADGTLIDMNPAGVAMVEADSRDQVVGESIYPLIDPTYRDSMKAFTRNIFRGESGTLAFEIVGLRGSRRLLESHAVPLRNAAQEIIALLAVTRDITEHRRAQAQLKDSEQRFRQIAENIREVFWMIEPDTDRIVYVSPAYEEIWGRSCRSLYAEPRSWLEAVHPEDRDRLEEAGRNKHLAGTYDETYRVVRPDGSVRWIRDRSFAIKDESGRVYRITGIADDITEQKAQQAALEHQAKYDALTGLANRFALNDRLRTSMEAANREGRSLALLLMDIDRFKEINDTLGHHHGDLLIRQIGPRLQSVLHKHDLVARMGGDEFAVLLTLAESTHSAQVAAKIMKAMEPPFEIEGLPIAVEVSIGIAVYPDHGTTPELVMQRADIAMYHAKQTGGYVVYDSQYDQYSPRRLALLGELRHAIEHDELVLHYQPKIGVATGRIVGVEALIRWRHPDRGMIPPDQFIGPAERTGLIKPLTLWVFKTAQTQCLQWERAGFGVPISINLSARNLHDPQFPDQLAELMRPSGINPDNLELEITESAIMTDPRRALETITRLKALGLRLAIDDFGIGYSSLAYLRRLPVETIKIDRSFVLNMARDANDAVIVRSTIDLAHSLGLQAVAEGVENQQSWDLLASLGCDAAQGYYMGRPMPADEQTRWLHESPWGLRSPKG